MVAMETITKFLLEHNAIRTGDFVLTSGATSSYYVDVKTAMTDPVLLKSIADLITNTAVFDIVAGVAVGGIPLCVATSLSAGTPFAVIRADAKSHGLADTIIGDVKGHRVLLVEDVTTSGNSALYGVKEIRAAGGIVNTVITVVDRCQGADETLGKEGIRLVALATLDELLKLKGINV
ncbi:MAG: orotate phosphoribosyltransferase [Euryarchaeota archaeon]|nr:orotate phosphoribosyltransferase [Euryarchaeota archaeon]